MKKSHAFPVIAGMLLLIACAKKPKVMATMQGEADRAPRMGQLNSAIEYGGGDGLSLKTAVVILHAKGEDDGVRSEYNWIARHHPNWKVRGQVLLQGKQGIFDKIICVSPDGKTVDVYFDISGFFGKW